MIDRDPSVTRINIINGEGEIVPAARIGEMIIPLLGIGRAETIAEEFPSLRPDLEDIIDPSSPIDDTSYPIVEIGRTDRSEGSPLPPHSEQ